MKSNYFSTFLVLGIITIFFQACREEEDYSPTSQPKSTYITIPDENFEKNLIRQGIDSDSIVNQKILRSDAKKVQHLNLNAVQMTFAVLDLKGIEGFSELLSLDASGQKLRTINLNQNKKLESLSLNNNSIEQINLRSNTKLKSVTLSGNKIQSVIGLENLDSLNSIYLSFNELENFTLVNSSVEYFEASRNQLKTIDFSQAQELKTIVLINNKLQNLNLRNLTLLENLMVSGNQLQRVELDQNLNLKKLYLASNLLTGLNISLNNELQELEVVQNPNLNCIKIDSSQQIATLHIDGHQALNTTCP